jgi:hypothetical protein
VIYLVGGGTFCLMLILWQTYDGFIAQVYESFNIKHTNKQLGGLDIDYL